MNHRECNQLDAYLLDLLEAGERAAFAEHLVGCPACAREIEVQRRLDGLLAQVGQAEEEPTPSVSLRFEQYLRARRRRVWSGLSALAAGLLVVVTWFLWPEVSPPNGSSIANNSSPPEPPAANRPKVSVRLGDSVIGLPIETSDPRVTIVWTYPVSVLATSK